MATLQNIRNRAGILISVVIGLSLLAFILGDFLSSGPSVFSSKRLEVAEIDGKSVNYMNYSAELEKVKEFYRRNYQLTSLDQELVDNINENVWRTTVRDIILGKSYSDLGLYVSGEELKTMLMGDSINTGGTNMVMDEPHPIVRNMFTNPETGEFNRFQMMNYFTAINDPQYKEERKNWLFFEDQIVDERMNQKYFALVRKGLFVNSLDARNFAYESESNVSFDFAYIGFNTIPDEEVSVSKSEIEAYYDEHKNEYRQDESRSIEYVVFPIQPSEADDQNAKEYIQQSKVAFMRSDNPISFVNNNSDIPYQDINYTREDLPVQYQDSIFNGSPGYIAGPYFEDNAYKLARLIEFVMVPDSVRARHILISLSVQRDDARAKAIADSLKNLVENGANFFTLARNFSADQSNSSIGGDLGWFTPNTMVKPFNDYCFQNDKGSVGVVKTNYGYHVIKIEDQSAKVKKAKLAIVERLVSASDETTQAIYSQAVQFGSEAKNIEEFRNLYAEMNLTPRFATDLSRDAKEIQGLQYSREIIRWSYENEENSISQIFDLNDKYVIAALTDVKEKGFTPLEDKEAEIEIAIRKQKKLEKLAADMDEKIGSANDIETAAGALETEINTAEKVRFSNPYVNMVGLEPDVVAAAYGMEIDQLSGPIIGANGVFVIQVTEKETPEELDVASARFRLNYQYESRVNYQGYEALIEKANIVDNRIKFF